MASYLDHWKMILISFVVSTASMFQFAYILTYINSAEHAFTDFVNDSYHEHHDRYLDENAFAWTWTVIVNCYQLGFLVGTILTPFAVEKLGRKRALISSSAFDLVGTAVQVLAICYKIPYLLAIGRFIIGIGSGLSSGAITLYLQEISPTHVRGLVSSFQELSISVITLLGLVLGLPTVLGSIKHLPYLVGIGAVSAFPKLILLWCPETPKFLYLKKRNEEQAVKAIIFYHGSKANFDKVIEDIKKEGEIEHSESDHGDTRNRRKQKILQFFYEPYLRSAILLGIVCFIAQETCGMVPLVEFSTKLLNYLDVDESISSLAAILIGVFNTITTTTALFLVERYGRKKLLLSGLVGIVIFQIVLMVAYIVAPHTSSAWPGYLATACIVGITSVFGLGPGTVPWFITSELVPQSVRSTAATLTQVCNIIVMFIINFAFLPLFYALTAYSFLILLIVPTALCIVYLYFALPETKNREIADIVIDLKKSKTKNLNVGQTYV